jgi:hypothetical protein
MPLLFTGHHMLGQQHDRTEICMTVPANAPNATGIRVTTKIFPLAFLLLLFKTNVTVDGVTTVLPWGSNFYSLPPGLHEVIVSFRYIFSKTMGQNRVVVEVPPGQTIGVTYRSPFLVFMGGSMKVEALPTAS